MFELSGENRLVKVHLCKFEVNVLGTESGKIDRSDIAFSDWLFPEVIQVEGAVDDLNIVR